MGVVGSLSRVGVPTGGLLVIGVTDVGVGGLFVVGAADAGGLLVVGTADVGVGGLFVVGATDVGVGVVVRRGDVTGGDGTCVVGVTGLVVVTGGAHRSMARDCPTARQNWARIADLWPSGAASSALCRESSAASSLPLTPYPAA
ncbi:MAG: hypothetical protein M3460_11705 [Actinomycetota bacterium]|nr:hypothetical protein [Actinomycetota bacterium]